MPTRKRPTIDWDEAQRLHDQDGWSFVEIGKQFGYSPKTVRVGLAARGVRMQAPTRLGELRRRLRFTWRHMRESCTDPGHRAYHVNGALGFTVCREWRDFEAFYLWARENGYRPNLRLVVERDEKIYSPRHCRWTKRSLVLPHIKREYSRVDAAKAATIDWDRVARLFMDERAGHKEIAEQLGTTSETIRNGLRKRGVRREQVLGLTHTREGQRFYRAWWSIHDRCENPRSSAYAYLGGRGIKVAKEWAEFEPFLRWAEATCAGPDLMLARRDPNRSFSAKNCVWETREVISRKRCAPKGPPKPRRMLLAFGELRGFMEWTRDPRCRVGVFTLSQRLKDGWGAEQALSEPPLRRLEWKNYRRELVAFGQTKGQAEWLRDRRCRVTAAGLHDRLRRGWSIEAALSTPPYKQPQR